MRRVYLGGLNESPQDQGSALYTQSRNDITAAQTEKETIDKESNAVCKAFIHYAQKLSLLISSSIGGCRVSVGRCYPGNVTARKNSARHSQCCFVDWLHSSSQQPSLSKFRMLFPPSLATMYAIGACRGYFSSSEDARTLAENERSSSQRISSHRSWQVSATNLLCSSFLLRGRSM